MPQQNKQTTLLDGITIPTPLTSGALDNPNAPQSGSPAAPAKVNGDNNHDELFPLLSKSPGFKEAMAKADASGSYDPDTTLPPAMIMTRNLRTLEESDLYKNATPQQRIMYQAAFYKKYVYPAQKAANYKGSFKEWLQDRGTYWTGKVRPKDLDKPLGGMVPGVSKSTKEGVDAFAGGVAKTGLTIAQTLEEKRRQAIEKFQNISKEMSFGAAMLNAEIAPHMGPIIMNPHYTEVRQSKTANAINDYLKDDQYFAVHGYQQTTKNKLMRSAGELTGDLPLFFATDGIAGVTSEALIGSKVAATLPMSGLAKVGTNAISNAAQGYLIGAAEGKDPNKEALAFGIGGGLLHLGSWQVTEGLISPAAKYFGKIFGWGGGKLINDLANHAEAEVTSKAPSATASPVATALAGSQKQKVSAAVIQSLNDLTNGNFTKAPAAAKREALAKLAQVSPEYAEQIGFIEQSITGVEAARNLVAQRAAVPEFNAVLTKLEKASGQQTHVSVAEAVRNNTAAQQMRRSSDKYVQEVFKDEISKRLIEQDIAKHTGLQRRASDVVPGAASVKSLEFGDNLTKLVDAKLNNLGLGRYKFEQRKDKLLFFLNVLTTENQKLGPTAERQKIFHALLNKLQEEFPGDQGRLPNLLAMSDKVWSDMEALTKLHGDNETIRYWRQHSRPGESPFAHEVELLQKAAKADEDLAKSAKSVPQETEEQAQNRKLKEAMGKTGSTEHTDVFAVATKALFPGKKFDTLTVEEQSKVGQYAALISKGRK